jgi:branched-chain amino acid transport system ATP-binding protein
LERTTVLEAKQVDAGYGDLAVLFNVSIRVEEKEIVSLIGSNGAGKSTLISVITGLLKLNRGEVTFAGKRIDLLPPHQIVALGISHIPEGRQIFYRMSVLENLKMGAYTGKDPKKKQEQIEWVFQLFPRLEERKAQLGGTLSGGEQQMLAIGRGLMSRPTLLILDEPSLGLSPLMVKAIVEITREINQKGTTILLVEQNVREALKLAQRAYVIQTGKIVLEGKGSELLESPLIRKAYLGL